MKKNTTKRSLLASVLALVMCVTMLVGTTFAWFTDSASTSVNKIEAGRLNVKLLDEDGQPLAKDYFLQWKTTDSKVLWEPNCTYDLEPFQIMNAGDLALKYKVVLKASKIDKTADGKSLLDVIEWTVKVGGEVATVIKDGASMKVENVLLADLGAEDGTAIIDGEKLTANAAAKITVTGHMKAEASNDYQGLTIDGFGITVYAAQVNHESDSNGTDYDVAAPYDKTAPKTPLVVSVGTAAELATALKTFSAAGAGSNVINLTQDFEIKTGETWTPASIDGYKGAGVITINGNGHTITGLNDSLIAGGFAGESGVIINDLTLDNVNIRKNNDSSSAVGAFIGMVDSMPTIELNNCKLTNSHVEGGHWTGGLIGYIAGYNGAGSVKTNVTIKNCEVIGCTIAAYGSGGAIIGHAGGNEFTYQTVENCTVKDCTISSTNTNSWRIGVVAGTSGVGELTINTITSTNNTLTQTGTADPNPAHELYGRFVPGKTGKLTIDRAPISN